MSILRMRDRKLSLGTRSYVMGIVNVTPDSFSDGGCYFDADMAVAHARALEAEGVDILDFGGQSTRPGHIEVPPEEEWHRLEPVLRAVCGKTVLPVSVDTYFPYVAQRALEAGADIVNDVSGVVSPEMADLIRTSGAAWVIMHAAELPSTDDAIETVSSWLRSAASRAQELGVSKDQICLDPGIGFGKDNRQNFLLIRETARVKVQGYAYLLGASRKRCIGAASGAQRAADRDFGTAAAHTIGILGGADIVRAHCGAGSVQAARVADAIRLAAVSN